MWSGEVLNLFIKYLKKFMKENTDEFSIRACFYALFKHSFVCAPCLELKILLLEYLEKFCITHFPALW